jgi:hypothetical protein
MMHNQRCGNGCRNIREGLKSCPAGGCFHHGIIHRLTPERREWISVVGCGSYLAPVENIIDADTQQAADYLRQTAARLGMEWAK